MMRRQIRFALAVLVATTTCATAQEGYQPERPDMPAAGAPRPGFSPAFTLPTDTGTMVQANVTAAGLNILGDAANEPSIAIDPTAPNRIVIGWRQFDTISSNFRQAGYAWSNDGGRHWHFPGVLTPGSFRSDPVLESDSAGNFYYYSLPSQGSGWRCDLFKSTNGGQSWSGPVAANGGDRAWMSIDKSGGVGDGHIYGSWDSNNGCCGPARVGRDTSWGTLPWPTPVTTPLAIKAGTTAVGPDGEVYAVGRDIGGISVLRSDNARFAAQVPAFTFSRHVPFGDLVTSFLGNPAGISGQTWVDVDRSTGPGRGHVYIVTLARPSGTDPADVMFSRSPDCGETWSPPVRINDDPQGISNWQWFPSMSVAPNGRIDVTWNDTRASLNFKQSQLFYSYSSDGGQTWAPNVALTPIWDSWLGWPQQNKIGDYYDQESDDVGVFVAMAATFNGEQDVYFLRINDWDCNKNGIGDSADLTAGTLHDCNANGVPDECETAAGVPVLCPCYANCDSSTTPPVLNVNDYICFQARFAQNDPYTNCDGSTQPPVLNILDFVCFQTRYAQGCP